MLMRFHGRPYHRYPWQFDPIFGRIANERIPPRAPLTSVALADPNAWFNAHPQEPSVVRADMDRLRIHSSWPDGFVHPTYWYKLGVPRDRYHVALLVRLTPLSWSDVHAGPPPVLPSRVEAFWREHLPAWIRLLEREPLLYTISVGRNRHARLLTGVNYQESDPHLATVRVQDPATRGGAPAGEDPWPLLRRVVANTSYALRCEPGSS